MSTLYGLLTDGFTQAKGVAMSDDSGAAGAMSYLFEVGVLKRAARTGWWFMGEKNPETVAEHSFRTSIVGTVLAAMEGADPARVSLRLGRRSKPSSPTTRTSWNA
jgi:hypothetical protein